MEQQKFYQVDFYVGLLDPNEFYQEFTIKEAVNKITDLLGDCTIIPCIGSYKHPTGVRVNMNTLKITKFINDNPNIFVTTYVKQLKEIFNQENIISNILECNNLKFNY